MHPSVNIAVCGDLGQLQVVPELNKFANLQRVYYASRLSRDARSLGLKNDQACNAFIKEYLVQFHTRFLRDYQAAHIYPLYDFIWQRAVDRHWQRCDVLHVVLQGKALEIIRRGKTEATAILGHPVLCHPTFWDEQLAIELDRLGVAPTPVPKQASALLEEIAESDFLFCLSNLVRDTFVAAGYAADRISVIPWPTDTSIFTPASEGSTEKRFRVLCVGQIAPIKGHVYLLEAWKRLALPDADLVLVGALRSDMLPLLEQYEGCFEYLGAMDRTALIKEYQRASVLVLPSVQDGFGLVVNEALACGTPVLISDHVGARDIVREGENGFIVPARDIDGIAERLLALYRSEELRSHLTDGALATRATLPTMHETVLKLAALYDKVFSRRSETRGAVA